MGVTAVVRAAGGVVWREGSAGREVLLVHRDRYDDWTFPKGKLDAGESWLDAGLREVEEETGFRCTAGPELPSVTYDDGAGRAKRVRYWAMQVLDGAFAPNDEVDELTWVDPDTAARLLTYAHDRPVLAALGDAVGSG